MTSLKKPMSTQNTIVWLLVIVASVWAAAVVVLHLGVLISSAIAGVTGPGLGETFQAAKASPLHPVGGYDRPVGAAGWAYAIAGLLMAGVIAAAAVAFHRVGKWRRARKSGQTTGSAVRAVSKSAALKEARKVLPEAVSADALIPLGWFEGQMRYAQLEDSFLVIAPARSGKTTNVVVSWILDAPGAVLATSTKPDIVYLTAPMRSQVEGGGAAVFDPRDVSGWPAQVLWSPVRGCEDLDEALARGKAMAQGGRPKETSSGNMAFFDDSAGLVVGYWLHAAAMKPGGSMRDLMRWSADFNDSEPVDLLNTSPAAIEAGWPDLLRGLTQGKSDATVGSLQMTIQRTMAPLNSPKVLSMVCPAEGQSTFDVDAFIESKGTLYVLSETESSSVAPILTMFTDFVVRRAQRLAEKRPGNRLWPGLRLVLDEVANIAPMPSLPSVMSDSGGRGITTMVLAQTFAQLVVGWGKEGARTIQANASVEMYLRAIKEHELLKELSERTTQYRAERISVSVNQGQRESDGGSRSLSTEYDHAMLPQDITQMDLGQALVFYRNLPFMKVRLTPFYKRHDAEEIKAGIGEYERLTGRSAA